MALTFKESVLRCNKHWKHQEEICGFSSAKERDAWIKEHLPSSKDKGALYNGACIEVHKLNL